MAKKTIIPSTPIDKYTWEYPKLHKTYIYKHNTTRFELCTQQVSMADPHYGALLSEDLDSDHEEQIDKFATELAAYFVNELSFVELEALVEKLNKTLSDHRGHYNPHCV